MIEPQTTLTIKNIDYRLWGKSAEELLQVITEYLQGPTSQSLRIVTLNPELLSHSLQSTNFRESILSASYMVADGVGIIWLAKRLNISIPRITGIDLAEKTLSITNNLKKNVALIGATPETLNTLLPIIQSKYPHSNIVYSHDGFFSEEEIPNIIHSLTKTQADLILVAMPFHRQESLLHTIQTTPTINAILIGVGGSFDVWSGSVQRAPIIFQKLGIEWIWRILKQPQRISRLIHMIIQFIPLLLLPHKSH